MRPDRDGWGPELAPINTGAMLRIAAGTTRVVLRAERCLGRKVAILASVNNPSGGALDETRLALRVRWQQGEARDMSADFDLRAGRASVMLAADFVEVSIVNDRGVVDIDAKVTASLAIGERRQEAQTRTVYAEVPDGTAIDTPIPPWAVALQAYALASSDLSDLTFKGGSGAQLAQVQALSPVSTAPRPWLPIPGGASVVNLNNKTGALAVYALVYAIEV